jgi:carboxymethylenebutenolidase
MGEILEFPSNGKTCSGYFSTPSSPGPGVVVIQEWWGLVPHVKEVADRFAGEGFVALAPDLYGGEATQEPDEANKKMMDLKLEQAAKDLSGAVDYLRNHDLVDPKKVGSVGFCMGGALSIWLATIKPVDACVVYYGGPFKSQPDYSNLKGPVLGHFAEHDEWASPDFAKSMFEEIGRAGGQGESHVYPGTEHAFFNDTGKEENPDRVGSYDPDAARQSWGRTIEFFKANLK